VKTRKLKRSAESHWLLCAINAQGEVWLSQRPTPGVWAGLYCFEMFASMAVLEGTLFEAGGLALDLEVREPIKHVLTHKDLHLHPVVARLERPISPSGRWVPLSQALSLGLPAPIKTMLQNM
jgi:A/G-specific adenine glycosylase